MVQPISTAVLEAPSRAGRETSTFWPPALAAFLGLFILYGVGFASPLTIHNAAHDSRHAFTFPCH